MSFLSLISLPIASIISALLIDSLYYCFFNHNPIKSWIKYGLLFALGSISFLLTFASVHYNVKFIIILIFAFGYGLIAYQGAWTFKIFPLLLCASITVAGDHFTTGVLMLGFEKESFSQVYESTYIQAVGTLILQAYVLLFIIVLRKLHTKDELNWPKSILLFGIPIITSVIIIASNQYLVEVENISGWIYVLNSFLFFLMIFLMLAFYYTSANAAREKQINTILSAQLETYSYDNEVMRNRDEVVSSIRHDIKNHLHILLSMIQGHKNKEAAAYIQSLSTNTIASLRETSKTNSIIDTIIEIKRYKATKSNIDFVTEISIPDKLEVDGPALCVVLGNALDNAVEACERIQVDIPRTIHMRVFLRRPYMIVEIKNSIDKQPETIKGKIISSKMDKNYHGFGLRNIETVLKKHNGYSMTEWYNNTFVFSCMMELPSKNWMKEANIND